MQAPLDVEGIDLLAGITGSRVRADVLAALYSGRGRSWVPVDLGRLLRRPRQVVNRELKRLASVGLIRVTTLDGQHRYAADRDTPVSRELFRLVRQTRGRIPRIRKALVALRSPTLAWVVAPERAFQRGKKTAQPEVFVLTGAPRSLVRVQLADLVERSTDIHCLSIREWVARLEKGDLLLREVRRGQKLWILGSWDLLLERESRELETKALLRSAARNWREELSDEWDEDWDPFAPRPGVA